MKLSEKGLKFIAEFEGIVLVPYRDSAGVWTIGVGHTAAAGPPDPKNQFLVAHGMSLGEALALFAQDAEKYAMQVSRVIPIPLEQHEFDALVCFHFNTGAIARGRDKKWKASLVYDLLAGRRKSAAAKFLAWSKVTINGKKITSTGLLARRQMERKLFETGDYAEPFMPRVWTQWPGKGRPIEL